MSTDATVTLPAQPPPMALPPVGAETEESSPRRGRIAAVAGLAAVAAGVAIAIAALGGGSGGDSKPQVKVRTRTQTVTTQTQTQPAPLTGDALGAQLNDRGYSLIQQGDYAGAIPILRHAVNSFSDGTSDINYAYALYNLGHALRLAGQPEAAIPILEQRLQIADQSGTVAAELAQAQQEAGVATGGVGPEPKPQKGPKEPKPGKGPKGAGGVEAD